MKSAFQAINLSVRYEIFIKTVTRYYSSTGLDYAIYCMKTDFHRFLCWRKTKSFRELFVPNEFLYCLKWEHQWSLCVICIYVPPVFAYISSLNERQYWAMFKPEQPWLCQKKHEGTLEIDANAYRPLKSIVPTYLLTAKFHTHSACIVYLLRVIGPLITCNGVIIWELSSGWLRYRRAWIATRTIYTLKKKLYKVHFI